MRTYEALYIVRPDLDDETIQTVAKDTESLVLNHGGAIVRSEIWGKRRLAYQVKKFTDGCYMLLRFKAKADLVARLENYFRLAESVIRYLVVHFDEQMLRLEAEQQQRQEEQLRMGAVRGRGGRDEDGDYDKPHRMLHDEDSDEEE